LYNMYKHNKAKNMQVSQPSKRLSNAASTVVNMAHVKIKIRNNIEMKMVINIFCVAIAMLLKISFYIVLLYIGIKSEAFKLFLFVSDVFSLINPGLLLASSAYSRKMLADFVIRREKYTI
jgi:hypothetical protein